MPNDFMLEPDAIEPEPQARTRPVRLGATGLAPTAAVPRTTRCKPDLPPAYASCAACGAPVLTGTTGAGSRLALDVGIATYVVDWHHGTSEPRLVVSRGYPVHRCQHQEEMS
jgi:hypothetical protein